ncbi:hypothetical protein ACH5RR_002785 [Cinchona calisaya]|uniref:Protein kinase domain-containing protein n=1 Tax=Cinchona calisaya TaxID=153742 RepID=A0ABD3AT36_9GENT
MIQVQILVVLLSLFLIYFLLSGFSLGTFLNNTCYKTGNHHLTSKQSSCEHRPSSCGNISAIKLKCPFRFEGDKHPEFCKGDNFEIACDKHNRSVLFLDTFKKQHFYVDLDGIDYAKQTIRVIDTGVHKHNCSTLPFYSFSDFYIYKRQISTNEFQHLYIDQDMDILIFVSCRNPVRSKSPLYVDTSSCNITENSFSKVKAPSSYSYVVVGENLVASDIEDSCTINKIVPVQLQCLPNITAGDISFEDIHNLLANGFKITWPALDSPRRRSFFCRLAVPLYVHVMQFITYTLRFKSGVGFGVKIFVLFIAARSVLGTIVAFIFLIYKWHRRHLSMFDNIEEFLQTSNNLAPIRYSYNEIKSMTNNFEEKLGEGGYGLVYKGKLRSGSLVAVKMLNKSKANGQEFINEVATIGRIHHVNVVRLVGFCVTASKHALVYDFMPNGSLDKFIFSECSSGDPLSWQRSYEIAVGVARGIDYLHQGCNMQILHFDIKPHNILLDEGFVPKVSDFGLAKLYPIQDGYLATLTAARGTIGYMAPELFYKQVGRVSNKADVYSYGMLLMEMAGRRKNINALAEHSSQIYFPSWIYYKIEVGEDMEIGDHVTEEEKAIARKIVLIALWCIQMTPEDRPSMREVLEMFESDIRSLQLPPKPLLYPPDSPILAPKSSHSSSEESTEPLCNSVVLEIEHVDA